MNHSWYYYKPHNIHVEEIRKQATRQRPLLCTTLTDIQFLTNPWYHLRNYAT